MAGVRGNFKRFAKLSQAVGAASTPGFRAGLSQGLAAAALKQLADSFQQSRDPYGQPWAPLKLRQGKPLLDTGALRASASISQSGPDGFTLQITAPYARTHQEGRKDIRPRRARVLSWQTRGGKRYFARSVTVPRRRMIPEGGKLGPYWARAFRAEARARVKLLFQGVSK